MNKKFSTLLTASLLMVGALFSSAQAQDKTYIPVGPKAEAISSGSMYYIVQQAGEDVAASTDYLMGMNKTAVPALAGLNVASGGTDLAEAFELPGSSEVSNFLWTVTEVKEANKIYYTLKNVKTGSFLALKSGNTAMETTIADATQAKSNIFFSFGDGTAAYSSTTTFLMAKGGSNSASSLSISSPSAIVFGDGSGNQVVLYSVKTQPVAATDLNAAFGGAGFSFAPDGVEVEDNIFDQSIKAFDVAADIDLEAGVRAIKKGTYFAVSYPDELAEVDKIATAEDFDACTFIAVSPTENFKTSKLPQGSGAGFKFVTVKGEDLNTYISGDNLSSKEEIYVGNAAFTVTEPNEFASSGKYTMSLSARVLADPKATSNKDQKHAAKTIDVIATAIQDVNYITTTVGGEGSLFKVASTKLVKAVSLLKEEKGRSLNLPWLSNVI